MEFVGRFLQITHQSCFLLGPRGTGKSTWLRDRLPDALARECEVERKVVAGYVGILEDLLLAFRLPVFRKRAKRATVAHEKIYLFDAGVFRSLRPRGPLDRPEEIDGQALEGLVAQHLRAWVAYSRQDVDLFYWRTRAGTEVDFIVYGETGLQAFEVKNHRKVHATDLRALRTCIGQLDS